MEDEQLSVFDQMKLEANLYADSALGRPITYSKELTLMPKHKYENQMVTKNDVAGISNVQRIISEAEKKDMATATAWQTLIDGLSDRVVTCRVCCESDSEEVEPNPKCRACGGTGKELIKAMPKYVELVMAEKFPKKSVSLTADLSNASTDDLLSIIDQF